MNSDDDPTHRDHYPQIKYKNKWYVMAPELYNEKLSDKTGHSRCTGCGFYNSGDVRMFHCQLQADRADDAMEVRAGSCDGGEDEPPLPHIYVPKTRWHDYIAQRVTIRMNHND